MSISFEGFVDEQVVLDDLIHEIQTYLSVYDVFRAEGCFQPKRDERSKCPVCGSTCWYVVSYYTATGGGMAKRCRSCLTHFDTEEGGE